MSSVSILFAIAVGSAGAGSIKLKWGGVPGATGYTLYYGSQSRQYDHSWQVGDVRGAVIGNLPPCTDVFVAVKARNPMGESAGFSNEVSGWPRPQIDGFTPAEMTQGEQRLIQIHGNNYLPGATVELEAPDAPTDVYGNPLVRVESASVVECSRIEALVTVEPTARGFRAAPVGKLPLQFLVRNPTSVWGRSPLAEMDILFDQNRRDVNRSDATTRDRVDGSDLTWLAYAFGSAEGDAHYLPDADLDGSGEVDGADLAFLASGFGFCRSGDTWSAGSCG